jgi:hypothetical protein
MDTFQHETHHNRHSHLAKEMALAMSKRRDAHLDRLRKRSAMRRLTDRTNDEREVRRRIREATVAAAHIDDALASRVHEDRRHRMKKVADEAPRNGLPFPPMFPVNNAPVTDPSGQDELWWAQTTWSTDDPNIVMFWEDDGLHFAGEIVENDRDIYMRRSVNVLAQFGLGPDRISRSGQVTSVPPVNVVGTATGATLASSIYDFGDQWSKCWLNMSQTVYVQIPGISIPPFGDMLPIGSNSTVKDLVFIEDNFGYESTYLPGPIYFPQVRFPIASGWTVGVDLEFWFDVQLDGDTSFMRFGENGSDFPSNLIQTPQWTLSHV